MLRKKLPRIWRIEKTLLSRGTYWKTAKIGIFLRSLIRNHARRVDWEIKYEDYQNYCFFFFEDSKIFNDPDSPSSCDSAYVSHQALITSSSRKPSRDIGMLRNTREEMSIPGNVFECQHARRDPDELHDDSRNLATTSAILRRNWEKWKRRTTAIDTFSLLFRKEQYKKSRRWKVSCVYD